MQISLRKSFQATSTTIRVSTFMRFKNKKDDNIFKMLNMILFSCWNHLKSSKNNGEICPPTWKQFRIRNLFWTLDFLYFNWCTFGFLFFLCEVLNNLTITLFHVFHFWPFLTILKCCLNHTDEWISICNYSLSGK